LGRWQAVARRRSEDFDLEHQAGGQMNRFGVAIYLIGMICGSGLMAAESIVRPGDHVAIVGNTFADQLRVRGYLETLLLQRTSGKLSIRNLGWAGDMLSVRDRPTNFPSEASTLTAHKTDLIVACFGMGESFAGENGLAEFGRRLKAFFESHAGKKYNGKTAVRLVLVSPIAYEDLGELTPKMAKRNRELAAYTRAMGEAASKHKVDFVNLYEPSLYLMREAASLKLTTNGIHLNDYGYWAMGRYFADALRSGDTPWRLRIDAKAIGSTANGVDITKLKAEGGGVSFMVTERSWPSLAPPTQGKIHSQLAGNRDRLIVENLAPGNYVLTIDGQVVATASHKILAQGIPVDASPAHKAAEAYRAAVNDKNQHFVYSWKALNQVHIVGERKKSASGRALPAEVLQFNKLTLQKDEALRKGVASKQRLWRVVPKAR
jgi:hypothetical protein